jgi:hypothetical protein
MRWNVKEAALACGVPAASWRGWELEGRPPRDYLNAVGKIARRTGCDIVWLAGFPVTSKRDQDAWDWPYTEEARRAGYVDPASTVEDPWAPRGSNPQPTDYHNAGSDLPLVA